MTHVTHPFIPGITCCRRSITDPCVTSAVDEICTRCIDLAEAFVTLDSTTFAFRLCVAVTSAAD